MRRGTFLFPLPFAFRVAERACLYTATRTALRPMSVMMGAARVPLSEVNGRRAAAATGAGGKRHVLLLVIFGALFWSAAGSYSSTSATVLSSSSLSLHPEGFQKFDQGEYPASNHGHSRQLLLATNSNGTFKLATERTDRRNPLDSLHTYRGGYDLRSKDYGASVGYTGLPAFVVTVLWIALGVILLLTLVFTCCCCRHRTKHEYDHGRLGYVLPLVALLFFTIAAIAGSVVLYYAQQEFNEELKGTLNYVVNQSETTEAGLRIVSANLTGAASIDIAGFFSLSDSDKAEIRQLNVQLNNSANTLHNKTIDNRKKIRKGIDAVRLGLIVVSGVMLALVLLGLLFSACGIRSVVYLLVVLGWILVTATWILCGIFIFIDNGIGDTCLAMQEWVANPEANTTLDEFLPCVDPATASSALSNSGTYTTEIVGLVNQGINSVVNTNPPPGTPGWYNQTGPLVPNLCNDQGSAPDYIPVPCAAGTVNFSQASTVWAGFLCSVDSNGICITPGRLSPDTFSQLRGAAGVAGSLSGNSKFLYNTANCIFVRDVFTQIKEHRCDDLRKYSKWIWIGLILVSGGAMLSVLSWIVYIRRRRYRYKNSKSRKIVSKNQSQQYSPSPLAA